MAILMWSALPVFVTIVACVVVALFNRTPHTDTTPEDIEHFHRFEGALRRQSADGGATRVLCKVRTRYPVD